MKAGGARLWAQRWFWRLLAGAALGVYLGEALYFAHHQRPVLDEGLYLYKGLLFMRGVYRPFQPYGPWTNHMPLSFLIPGAVQAWFGPGLRVGRYFAVLIGLLLWVGIWVLTRRFAGERWAAWAMVAATAMPIWARVYSLAASEGLAAAMLVWGLVAGLRAQPRPGHLAAAGLVLGALVVTRLNLSPVPLLLALFLWWQQGWRRALWFVLPAALVVGVVHAWYWPEILRLWLKWVPASWAPFLSAWRGAHGGEHLWAGHAAPFYDQALAAAEVWQDYALAWAGLGLALAVAGTCKPTREHFRCAALWFLASLSLLLAILHAVVSLGSTWCLGCLQMYAAFFAPLALVAGALGLSLSARRTPALWTALLTTASITLLAPAAGNYQEMIAFLEAWGPRVLSSSLYEALRHLTLRSEQKTHALTHWPPLFAGRLVLLGGLAVVVVGAAVWVWRRKARWPWRRAAVAWLMALTTLSPLPFFSGHFALYDCPAADALREAAATGAALRAQIPSHTTLYWRAYSPVPLLYLPLSVRTFPPQLNGMYSYYLGGDADRLARLGLWNQTLARRWLEESDLAVVEARYLDTKVTDAENWRQLLARSSFRLVGRTPASVPCVGGSELLIYAPQR